MLRVLVTADELVRAAQAPDPSQGGADSNAADTTVGAADGGLHSLLRLQALRACVAGEEAAAEEAAGEAAEAAVEVGFNAAADAPSTGRGTGAQLTRSLLQLLDQRVCRLVETMREPLAARVRHTHRARTLDQRGPGRSATHACEPCLGQAAAALRGLGWPGEVAVGQPGAAAHEAAVQAVRAAFTALLLLQYCAQPYCTQPDCTQPYSAAQEPPSHRPTLAGAAGSSALASASGLGSGTGPLWAVEAMVQPVLRRFRFHFEGRRETNRSDAPGYNTPPSLSLSLTPCLTLTPTH